VKTFSHYGIGVKVHAIERLPDDRVAFTLWFTVFFIPLFPPSSWSAMYDGEFHHALNEDGHAFTDLVRIRRGLLCHLQTFTFSLLVLALFIAPAGYLILRTTGRAATPVEMVLVFASCVWPVVVVTLLEQRRRKLLRGARRQWTR
jgi:hypothetical protein